MVLIENKLEIFRRIVFDKKNEILKKELLDTEKKFSDEYEKKKIQIEKEGEELIQRRVQLATQKAYEMKSAFAEEKRILDLQNENDILSSFFNDLKERISTLSREDKYNNFYSELFKNCIENLDKKEWNCYLLDSDVNLRKMLDETAKNHHSNIYFRSMNTELLGGFILRDLDETIQINYSLAQILNEKRYDIGKMIFFKLKEKGAY